MSEHEQPALIAALLHAGSYPHPAANCELIETHISWVILAGEYAYKVKKPLDLGFLDFSTLEKRRFYCEEEVRLNCRLAPSLYLEAVAIGGTPEQPLLGAESGIFEYAVKMRRFPQQAQLDRMLERGVLEPVHIDAFARMAAEFHQRIDVADEGSDFGSPEQVWQPVTENFLQIREHLPDGPGADQLAVLERWCAQTYERLHPLFGQRKRGGYIRECHGDMHLRNLAWLDGQPVAFDCIEFNPALRWIDVISEVAFLVMDLQERGQPRLAQRFLNNYLEISGDYQALALLPFYQVYRAMVRAKVAAIRAGQPDIDQAERGQALEEFAAYLAMARHYTRAPKPALLVARGMSASGKTTLTEPVLEQLGAIRLRSDVERKRLMGLRSTDDGHAAPGKGIYTPEAGERTYDRLAELAAVILDAGYTVIIDAVCQRRSQRDRFRSLARARSVPYLLVEFQAAEDELERRIVTREKGASDAGLEVLRHQISQWQAIDEDEQTHALQVDTGQTVDGVKLYQRIKALL